MSGEGARDLTECRAGCWPRALLLTLIAETRGIANGSVPISLRLAAPHQLFS
jgi:hypothetical protein